MNIKKIFTVKNWIIYTLVISVIWLGLVLLVGTTTTYKMELFYDDGKQLYFKRSGYFSTRSSGYDIFEDILIYDTEKDEYKIIDFERYTYITSHRGSSLVSISNSDGNTLYMYDVASLTTIDDDILNECFDREVYCAPLGNDYISVTELDVKYDEIPADASRYYTPEKSSSQVKSVKIYSRIDQNVIGEYEYDITREYKHSSTSTRKNYEWYSDVYYNEIEGTVKYLYGTRGYVDEDSSYIYLLYDIDINSQLSEVHEIEASSASFLESGVLHSVRLGGEKYFHNIYDDGNVVKTTEVHGYNKLFGNYIIYSTGEIWKYNEVTDAFDMLYVDEDKIKFSTTSKIVNDFLYYESYLESSNGKRVTQTVYNISSKTEITFNSSYSIPKSSLF